MIIGSVVNARADWMKLDSDVIGRPLLGRILSVISLAGCRAGTTLPSSPRSGMMEISGPYLGQEESSAFVICHDLQRAIVTLRLTEAGI